MSRIEKMFEEMRGIAHSDNAEHCGGDDSPLSDKYIKHAEICAEMNRIYRTKNEDYGDSFGKGFCEYGILMPVIRLEDKFNRFKKLAMSGEQQVKDESIKDTLIDLANYAIMTVIEMEEQK